MANGHTRPRRNDIEAYDNGSKDILNGNIRLDKYLISKRYSFYREYQAPLCFAYQTFYRLYF